MTKTQTTNTRMPVTVSRTTFVQSLIIAILATAVAASIFGYFAGINVHYQARQNVIQDMTIVLKDQSE